MNQTRTFLIFAWLLVAAMLWMAWGQEQSGEPRAASTLPATVAGQQRGGVPAAPAAATGSPVAPAAAAPTRMVTITTDVLHLKLDGGSVRRAELRRYPQTTDVNSPPVTLFDDDPTRFFEAQSGWVSAASPAPTHESGFVPEQARDEYVLAANADRIEVPFLWRGPNGVTIRRIYGASRGSYVLDVRDEIVNAGNVPWSGFIYRQLSRVPPQVETGFTHPESYSFHGAAWYGGGGYGKRKFEDFIDDGPLDLRSTGGWIAMLQHHFFSAWIPVAQDASTFSLAVQSDPGGARYLVREVGPGFDVAPGSKASTQARLWVGPKLVAQIEAQRVPGLERAVDFSSYGIMASLAGVLFMVLSWLHGVFGNWGWSIIGLVVVIKALMFPLSTVQYKSAAKMRRFQPRMQQLKERYGEDRQKFQLALMELYRKEKINPMGGCLPVLVQMPIFLALYWTLLESVELRHAPWIGWIQNLTAPDPYFILPVLNIAVMWITQKLTPMVGMDPMQQRMMQMMPLIFGVMMIFFPAGLVLYWVTNGVLSLLQQWYMLRKYGDPPSATAKPPPLPKKTA